MAGQAVVTIRDKQWQCAVANMPQELVSGLSGVESIPPGTGMLFDMGWDYPVIDIYTDEMLFTMDVIFINSAHGVVEVLRNVRPGDEALFQAELGARYFLEINAGEAEGSEVGNSVLIQPGEEMPEAPSWITGLAGLAGFAAMGIFMVGIARSFTDKAPGEPEEKPMLLPRTSQGRQTGQYEIETDRMGNIIITRSDDPGKDVFLQFESDKALVYDLLRKGEKKELNAGWKVKIRRTEPRASILDELWESAAQPRSLTSTVKKPSRHDVEVVTWAERDRIGIWITDRRTDKVIAQWWDEDAREMFEQGWFKPGDIRHQAITGQAFEESVLDYAESVGLLAGGKYLAQTVKDVYYWTAINKDSGEITESYAPYTSSGRALRGGKAFVSRHWRGEALIEVWKEPFRYSESLKIQPVASETLILVRQKAPAVIPEHKRQPRLKGEIEFLPDSPEFLAYTIDDIGYRDKIDSAFLSAIARAGGGK
jgi:uncharacterized membrane protein (UPF0127 family)